MDTLKVNGLLALYKNSPPLTQVLSMQTAASGVELGRKAFDLASDSKTEGKGICEIYQKIELAYANLCAKGKIIKKS